MFLLNDSTHRMLMRYHPVVGHLHVPNLVARVPHEAGGYLVRTNSSGFRSDIEFIEQIGERPRILVFGDSFTAGEGCGNQQRFAELLGRDLDAEVYNYGMSGSAPDQHILLLQEFGQHTSADLIIWTISIHNVERVKLTHRASVDRVTGKPILVPKPYFALEEGGLKLHHVPVPRARPDLQAGRERDYAENGHIDPPLLERLFTSPILAGLRTTVQRSLPGLKDRIRGLAYRFADVQMYDDYLDERSPGWLLLSALIRKFRMEVNGVPILIVPLPTYHYYVDRLRPVYQDLFETLEDLDSGLFVCNITNGLREGKNLAERKAICFPTDTHYSPYGHQEIARLIANIVRSRGLLPKQKDTVEEFASITSDELYPGRYVLGLAFGAEESAAALVRDGEIIAIAKESSFTRIDNQGGFPHLAANYCLEAACINQTDLSAVAYGGAPYSELERDAHGLSSNSSKEAWRQVMANWVLHDLNTYPAIRRGLSYDGVLLESGFSTAQCTAAFYSSPYTSAAVISVHGDKQRAATTIAVGSSDGMKLLKESAAPHDLQTFYTQMAQFINDRKAGAEAELRSLAQVGKPEFVEKIREELISLNNDGSIVLNPDYFAGSFDFEATSDALKGFFKTDESNGQELAGHKANLAKSVKIICCDAMVKTARFARDLTGETRLCIAGSLVHDPEIRRALLNDGCFNEIWIQPVAGHANAALGAALTASYEHFDVVRPASVSGETRGSFDLLGPEFSSYEIDAFVDTYDYPSVVLEPEARARELAELISQGSVVGHFAGRLGVGTNSMGDRLILSDSRHRGLSVSSNLTSVGGDRGPGVNDIIREFKALTGCDTLMTVPFKLPHEPTVCSPLDAYRCFMLSDMNVLALGHRLLVKEEQPAWPVASLTAQGGLNSRHRMSGEKLMDALGQLYEKKCKAIVRKNQNVATAKNEPPAKQTSSPWIDCAATTADQSVSVVPAEMEKVSPRPGILAKTMVSNWESSSLQAQFRPILVRLARLHRRLAAAGRR